MEPKAFSLLFVFVFSQMILISSSRLSNAGNASGAPSLQEFGQCAGYYSLARSKSAKMFYFFFESQNNQTDPVVIWLTGGPGCSSSVALFHANGPFRISEDFSLSRNEFSWNKVSNLIYVDQPVGTGFSTSSDPSDFRHDEDGVSSDLYDFLQNNFYITGESYAGHYIPALASRIHEGNKRSEGIPINLKGFAIGNGLTNPEIQYGAYGDYALDMKLISESEHESLKKDYTLCQSSIRKCNLDGGLACDSALDVCEEIPTQIMMNNVPRSMYDLRKTCFDVDCFEMETFLNLADVRKALGVGDAIFEFCNDTVSKAMQSDWMRNLEPKIPNLVEDGIDVLVYAGEYDFVCNWLGNARWVDQMSWSGQRDFVAAKTVSFLVDGKEAGLVKNHGSLTFLKVHDAGHVVPMDQPKVSLEMLQNWMRGKLANTTY